jgi:hypothetical protein
MADSTGMLYVLYYRMFIEHPNSTDDPRGYWAHCSFSLKNSLVLMFFCLLGVIHSIFPCVFKFSTSSAVIRSFRIIVRSQRHKEEIRKYISKEDMQKLTEQSQKE